MMPIFIGILLLFLSSVAKADVICTMHQGCFETGKRLKNNGGVYRGLEHRIETKTGVVRKVLPTADLAAPAESERVKRQ
jgi:hypothetical protein